MVVELLSILARGCSLAVTSILDTTFHPELLTDRGDAYLVGVAIHFHSEQIPALGLLETED